MKVLHSICQQIWKAAMATGLEKVSFHSNTKERQCQRSSNFHTITLISHAGKIMLKILPARLQQYVNRELPDVQDGFRNSKGARDQIGNIHWIIEKAREFQKKEGKKKSTPSLTMKKPLCGYQQNSGKFLNGSTTRPPYLFPKKALWRTRSNS